MRSFLPRSDFELSALPEILEVEQALTDRRTVHTAFATTLLTIDHGLSGSERSDALKGLVQTWDYFARQHGEDVVVEYSGQPWQELTTSIIFRKPPDEVADDDNQYAVINTADESFFDLGGTALTSSLETAATHAQLAHHFELVHLRPIRIPDHYDSQLID